MHAGSIAALLGTELGAAPAVPGLVLEIRGPGATSDLLVVPGTESPDVEKNPLLLFDKGSNRLTLIWEAKPTSGKSSVWLVDYDGTSWSEPQELFSSRFGWTSSPLRAVTRDAYDLRLGEGGTIHTERSTVHFAWRESSGGSAVVRYTPIFLVEGSYVGWNQTFTFESPGDDGSATTLAAIPQTLYRHLSLEASPDGRSVVLAFTDAAGRHVVSINVETLPLELAYLSDEVREEVLELSEHFTSGDIASLSDEMRTHIIHIGALYSLQPEVVDYVSAELESWLANAGDQYENVDALADAARQHTIALTASLFGAPVTLSAPDSASQILEIDLGDFLGGLGDPSRPEPAQVLGLKLASRQETPTTGTGPTRIYTSAEGQQLLIAWETAAKDRVEYVESQGEGWSEKRSLLLGDDLSLGEAYELLHARMR
ncbi:MAG: hypothetical protein HC897_16390 [Thermoanaerobaculia bacterium]|nr:hypothetical protein [Thermoanaerobaculia bacterium]